MSTNMPYIVLHPVYTLSAEVDVRSPDARVKAGQELEAVVALSQWHAKRRAGAAHQPCFVSCLLCVCAG